LRVKGGDSITGDGGGVKEKDEKRGANEAKLVPEKKEEKRGAQRIKKRNGVNSTYS